MYATAFISLGLANLDFGAGWLRGQGLRLAFGVPLVAAYVYVEMPALVFPQAFVLLALTLVPNAAYAALRLGGAIFTLPRGRVPGSTAGLLRGAHATRQLRRRPAGRAALTRPYALALGAVALFALVLLAAPIVDAGGLRDLVHATTSTQLPASADLRHLRVVPAEAATFAGDKVVGQLGAYYRPGDFDIQSASGRLVWVAPLEFQGIVQWLVRGTSPGVIVVGAERADAPAELRLRAPLRYLTSAAFNSNLYRHVYLSYGTEAILATMLQLDDRGDPMYVATLGRPTIGFTGDRVTGVVVVDPVTGAMRRYDRSDAALPAWISRVVPPALALSYNEWFGRYVHGFWNALIARRDVHVPARDEVFGILAAGRFVWFVDHTSPASDQSMTGFTYLDSVSGRMTYFTSSGGEFDSLGAENAVASNPIVKQGRLRTTQPILYTVGGKNTWIVPLVADTGKVQSLALAFAENGHVTVGDPSSPSPQNDALARYTAFLEATPGASHAERRSLSGVIDRIAPGAGGVVYFTVNGRRTIYRLDVAAGPAVALARPGDRVRFSIAAGEPAPGDVTVGDFADQAFGP